MIVSAYLLDKTEFAKDSSGTNYNIPSGILMPLNDFWFDGDYPLTADKLTGETYQTREARSIKIRFRYDTNEVNIKYILNPTNWFTFEGYQFCNIMLVLDLSFGRFVSERFYGIIKDAKVHRDLEGKYIELLAYDFQYLIYATSRIRFPYLLETAVSAFSRESGTDHNYILVTFSDNLLPSESNPFDVGDFAQLDNGSAWVSYEVAATNGELNGTDYDVLLLEDPVSASTFLNIRSETHNCYFVKEWLEYIYKFASNKFFEEATESRFVYQINFEPVVSGLFGVSTYDKTQLRLIGSINSFKWDEFRIKTACGFGGYVYTGTLYFDHTHFSVYLREINTTLRRFTIDKLQRSCVYWYDNRPGNDGYRYGIAWVFHIERYYLYNGYFLSRDNTLNESYSYTTSEEETNGNITAAQVEAIADAILDDAIAWFSGFVGSTPYFVLGSNIFSYDFLPLETDPVTYDEVWLNTFTWDLATTSMTPQYGTATNINQSDTIDEDIPLWLYYYGEMPFNYLELNAGRYTSEEIESLMLYLNNCHRRVTDGIIRVENITALTVNAEDIVPLSDDNLFNVDANNTWQEPQNNDYFAMLKGGGNQIELNVQILYDIKYYVTTHYNELFSQMTAEIEFDLIAENDELRRLKPYSIVQITPDPIMPNITNYGYIVNSVQRSFNDYTCKVKAWLFSNINDLVIDYGYNSDPLPVAFFGMRYPLDVEDCEYSGDILAYPGNCQFDYEDWSTPEAITDTPIMWYKMLEVAGSSPTTYIEDFGTNDHDIDVLTLVSENSGLIGEVSTSYLSFNTTIEIGGNILPSTAYGMISAGNVVFQNFGVSFWLYLMGDYSTLTETTDWTTSNLLISTFEKDGRTNGWGIGMHKKGLIAGIIIDGTKYNITFDLPYVNGWIQVFFTRNTAVLTPELTLHVSYLGCHSVPCGTDDIDGHHIAIGCDYKYDSGLYNVVNYTIPQFRMQDLRVYDFVPTIRNTVWLHNNGNASI